MEQLMNDLQQDDLKVLEQQGITRTEIERQLALLRTGVSSIVLDRPATIGDGILAFDEEMKKESAAYFSSNQKNYNIVKFVPASGAASRMFKDLYEYIISGKDSSNIDSFFINIREFAFSRVMSEKITQNISRKELIMFLLHKEGLDYGSKPKGLLPFHIEKGKLFTPIESHIYEAVNYSTLSDGSVAVHFTLPQESIFEAEEKIWNCVFELEDKFGIECSVQLSVQSSSTDTISLDQNGEIFRDKSGKILFRPGGHGSLVKNLEETNADIIYIRNIDNILSPEKNVENIYYKKILGGFLIRLVEEQHSILNMIEKNDPEVFSIAKDFLKRYFRINLNKDELKENNLRAFFHRPVRVCGMVKNLGEPGGGPFWVKEKNGKESLQIVEASQVSQNEEQQKILKSSTHFNPVDIVCSVRDHKGNKYDLKNYIDFDTSFIADKSVEGSSVKVLEHPGLWNGSMAGWLTVFVEIPASTFNPVKTVFDLLKPQHRGNE